jgi:predicted helicase
MELLRRPATRRHQVVGLDVLPACCIAVRMMLAQRTPRVICANVLTDVELGESLFLQRGDIPVIVGNPPYSNFGKQNQGNWIRRQLATYKRGLNERKVNLDDDFIKFLRWGQYWIDRAGRGVLAMVTNNTYLSGLTHREMRASLLRSFDRAYFVDLHGDRKRTRGGTGMPADENIFDIQQGVAVCVLTKTGRHQPQRTTVAQLTGSRAHKLKTLEQADATSLAGVAITPAPPQYFFHDARDAADQKPYSTWPALNEIFPTYTSGVQSKRDALFVGFTAEEVADRMQTFLADAKRAQFAADVPAWLQRKSAHVEYERANIRPYMVAPLDVRWIYYEPRLLGRARHQVMRHLQRGNCGLVFMRQSAHHGDYDHFLVTSELVSDRVFYSAHGAPFFAPLMLHTHGTTTANFSRRWADEFRERLGSGDRTVLPQDLFHWIYAVVHSSAYRQRFESWLRVGFPRIPWPASVSEFTEATRLGRTLAELHLAACHAPALTNEPGQDFDPACIADALYQHRIGGYPVLPRWLKQRRRSRGLGRSEVDHVRHLVDAIRQTRSLTEQINQTITASW